MGRNAAIESIWDMSFYQYVGNKSLLLINLIKEVEELGIYLRRYVPTKIWREKDFILGFWGQKLLFKIFCCGLLLFG